MEWTRGQTVGRGSTATVSIATVDKSGQSIAVKSAELPQSKFLQKEQSFFSALSCCPQIITYKGHDVTKENGKFLYNIFLEYAPGGTLIDAIRNHGGCIDESMIKSYTKQILQGLHHLHSNGIVHCDIKCHNILVATDGVKIADLGCARRVDEEWSSTAGTPVYMAPEVARGEHQGFPADVWALGCAVVEMATGKVPWANVSDPVSALYQIGFSGNVPEIPNFMSKQAKDFLNKCLKMDPTERWSASELLKHHFITQDRDVDSPTSVLNQGQWQCDSRREEFDPIMMTWKSTHKIGTHYSPMERIRRLAQDKGEVPKWALDWDDGWVTVRSKDNAREMCCSSDECNLAHGKEGKGTNNGTGIVWVSGEYNWVSNIPNQPTSIGGQITLAISHSFSSLKILTISSLLREMIYVNVQTLAWKWHSMLSISTLALARNYLHAI